MNCKRAQDCIERYWDKSLSDYELEDFIQHMKACNVCREELEIYYIIDMAQNFLDEDVDASYNVAQIVEKDMNERLEARRRKRRIRIGIISLSLLLLIAAGWGLGIVVGII